MNRIKSRIFSLVITLISIKAISMVLLSGASWKFQKTLFNYRDHTETINNVIEFNDLSQNQDLTDKTLAFGNSQTRSIFRTHLNKSSSDFYWSYIGAFRFGAWPYYMDNIININPDRVVFYISDKDLNYTVVFHSLYHHPFPLYRYLFNMPQILKHTGHSNNEVFQIAATEIVTPFKFSYQFKHLAKKLFTVKEKTDIDAKNEPLRNTRKVKSMFMQQKPEKPAVKKKAKKKTDRELYPDLDDVTYRGVKGLLNQRNVKRFPDRVAYNTLVFENMLKALIANGIKIVFVEGQYHPRAYNHSLFEGEDPHKLINEIANRYKEISVIDISDQPILTPEEYTDHIHFTKAGGKKLKQKIFEILEISE